MFQKLLQLPKLARFAHTGKKWIDLLGFDIRKIETKNNEITCTISFPEKLTGNDGIIHGGITCFIIDSMAGIVASLENSSSKTPLTKNLHVDFLIPITPGTIYSLQAIKNNDKILVSIMNSDNVPCAQGVVTVVLK
jgi:uncharacterized protein (TIGR00369 family)